MTGSRRARPSRKRFTSARRMSGAGLPKWGTMDVAGNHAPILGGSARGQVRLPRLDESLRELLERRRLPRRDLGAVGIVAVSRSGQDVTCSHAGPREIDLRESPWYGVPARAAVDPV